jgi:thioredoxin-related protein
MPNAPKSSILAGVMIVLLTSLAAAGDKQSWHTNYSTARKQAIADKKPMLVVIGSDQCVYCRKLEQNTLAEAGIAKLLQEQFICLKINANTDPDFARAMKVTMYPTTVVAGVDGKVYGYLAGYLEPKSYAENITKALGIMPKAEPAVAAPKAAVVASLSKPVAPDPNIAAPEPKSTDNALSVGKNAPAFHEAYQKQEYAVALQACQVVLQDSLNAEERDAARQVQEAILGDPEKLARASVQLESLFAKAYFTLAEAHAKQGHTSDALAHYHKVVQAAPDTTLATQATERIRDLSRAPTSTRQER